MSLGPGTKNQGAAGTQARESEDTFMVVRGQTSEYTYNSLLSKVVWA